ncbi:MAG TPA: hypothetical protein VFA09_23895 [Ktedonobacteraceae bacterium]|nr:hypothetical protein [Ktedonobacteraceae bacterium]
MNDSNRQSKDEQLDVSPQQEFPGDSYPHKYVHSVFVNEQDATQAIQALRAAGYTPDDIHFMAGQDFVQAAAQGDRQENNLSQSLFHFISSLQYDVTDAYLKEARRGHYILSVRISRHDQIAEVRDILALHHGELLQYVDAWTRADLSDSSSHGDW